MRHQFVRTRPLLTYLLHERVFRADEGKELEFPAELTVTVNLAPATVFGTGHDYGRLLVHNTKAHMLWNANTGRIQCKSDKPLSPLDVTIESDTTKFRLKGDVLIYQCPCEDLDQLLGCLNGLQFVFPAFLNLKFPDPPLVESIRGKLGSVDFCWEHGEPIQSFSSLTTEILEEHVAKFTEALPLFTGTLNRRLLAAIHYFYINSRLLVSGHSQWEFMAECILNLCKVLEILFGRQKDAVRQGLAALDYQPEEIEGDFIPMVILRDVVDVAHPRIAIFPKESLMVLYRYLSHSERRFRDLLLRVIEALKSGQLVLPQDSDLTLSTSEKRKLNTLVDNLRPRNL